MKIAKWKLTGVVGGLMKAIFFKKKKKKAFFELAL